MIFAKMVLSRRPSEIERVYCKRGCLRERVLWFYRETWALRLGFFSQPLDRKGRSDGLNNTGALSDVVSYVALLRVNIMAAALAHSYMQLLYYPRRFLSIFPPPPLNYVLWTGFYEVIKKLFIYWRKITNYICRFITN